MKPYLMPLLLLALLTSLPAFADDDDGMDDTWEVSMGLNPNDPTDAFGDKDGDRVPNLWEFARGTDPTNAGDAPEADAVVQAGTTDVDNHIYPTLQAAYDSLETLAEGQLGIVKVLAAATIRCKLDTQYIPRKVLWLAELQPESIVLRPEHIDDHLKITEEMVMDGFVFDFTPGIITNGPALSFLPSSSLMECRLVNTLIRRWHPTSGAGAISNSGAALTLLHCTISDCDGNTGNEGHASVDNQSGTLSLINSIVWSRNFVADAITGSVEQVTCLASVVQGGTGGAININPMLTKGGYLTASSSACLGQGTPQAGKALITRSVTGWDRGNYMASVDMGADHWENNDSDSLPKWWEWGWFGYDVNDWGNLDDPDADELNNLSEFMEHTSPITPRIGNNGQGGSYEDWAYYTFYIVTGGPGATSTTDIDGDGLTNTFENAHFSNSHYRNGKHDADEDGITDVEEAAVASAAQWWDSNANNLRDVNPITAHGTGAVKITSVARAGNHLAR